MNNAAKELKRLAEAQTKNPFKKGAFTKAAKAIQFYDDSELATMTFNELKQIPGVGESSAKVILDLYTKGSCERLEKECLPRECNFTELRGVGIVTARRLIKKYGVVTIEELEACDIPDDLRQKIETWKRLTSRLPRYEVEPLVNKVVAVLSKHHVQVAPVGSYRRFKSTIGDLDFVVYSNTKPKTLAGLLKRNLNGFELESLGEHKLLCNITIGDVSVHADFIFPNKESVATSILYLTGSKDFNVGMRAYAKRLGYTLNEHGLFKGKKRVKGRRERDVFDILGLPYIHACARELYADDFDSLVTGYSDVVPADFVAHNRHCFHTHSTYSDGVMTIRKFGQFCRANRFKLCGMSDHSYPNPAGLKPAHLSRYIAECREYKLFAGIELEVMGNGSLPKGFTPRVLSHFDYIVLACHIIPHSNVVSRLAKALKLVPREVPVVLAHLTGRVIGTRDTADINVGALKKLFRVRRNLILEINGWAERLDPPAPLLQRINKHIKPPIVYGPDAHSLADIKGNYNNCHRQALKGHVTTQQVARGLKILRNKIKG